jgi:hypothetical protein
MKARGVRPPDFGQWVRGAAKTSVQDLHRTHSRRDTLNVLLRRLHSSEQAHSSQ